jgi:mannose-6-phosphate isomerase-like protein (cupin superfamily)
MVKVAVLNLKNSKNQNRWIIGSPNDVPKKSPFYSEQIQIEYVKNPKKKFFEKEVEHYHKPPIEEYVILLKGKLKIKIENKIIILKPSQVIVIPPKKHHRTVGYSSHLEFLTIRAPISTKKTKIELK